MIDKNLLNKIKNIDDRETYLIKVLASEDIKTFLQTHPSLSDLIKFHTNYKYLIYAKSQKSYKDLGNIVANREKKDLKKILAEYKEAFLKAISIKSSVENRYNILLHIYGYFKNHLSKEEKEEVLDICKQFKDEKISLAKVVEVLNFYIDKFDITYLKSQKFLKPYPQELSCYLDKKALK